MCIFVDCLLSPCIIWSAFFGLAIYVIRQYMQGGQYTKQSDESGKIVIVTGANAGIGRETALELARRGATVYLACRDKKRGEEAVLDIIRQTNNQNVFFRKLDLASLDSVREFAANFKQEQNKLHILVNNAGLYNSTRELTKDGFELHLGVNHLGHFLLTILLLDLLKTSEPSRIVNVSSMGHTMGKIKVDDFQSEKSYGQNEAYFQSKLANVMFTRELARRLEGTRVTVNALHPGAVKTEIARNLKLLQNTFIKHLLFILLWPFVKTARSGAQTTLYAALDPDLNGVSGLYFSDCKPKKVANHATDEKIIKLLWEQSEKWTGAPKVL